MATVIGKTSEKIDELLGETIVNGLIDETGNLVLVQQNGGEVSVPGLVRSFGSVWSSATAYLVEDVVGYMGSIWKALSPNTNMPPSMYTTVWQRIHNFSIADWMESDPYFNGNNLSESWDTSVKTGSPTAALTTTTDEYLSGGRGLKVTLSSTQVQNIRQVGDNMLNFGEYVIVQMRAKVVAPSAGTNLNVQLLLNDTNNPAPGASGLVTTAAGSQELSTFWTTYTFVLQSGSSTKSRAAINVLVSAPSNSAVVLIDHIRVYKGLLPKSTLVDSPDADASGLEVVNAGWVHTMFRGTVLPFAGSVAPEGTLLCDGASHPVADYPDLAAVIGYTYGGSGANFNVPDMRHRLPFGAYGDLGANEGVTDPALRDTDLSHEHTHAKGTLVADGDPTETYDNNMIGGSASRAGASHGHTISGTTASGGATGHPRVHLNYIIVC